jgi:biopolymer transport protein ExbD
MARRTTLTNLRQISEINLTPLMDLTFILLITFIITFPLIEQGIPVNLPKADAEEVDSERMRTVTIDAEGKLYLDGLSVAMDQFGEEMAALGLADPETVVLVRADQDIKYARLMEVIRALRKANITRMGLVTEAENE